MSKYPCFLYHPTKPAFICPSEEFLLSLSDHEEYEYEPFTGPRTITKTSKPCGECLKLKIKITKLEEEKENLKSEVDRLRIAVKMGQKNTSTPSTLSQSVRMKAVWAKRKAEAGA